MNFKAALSGNINERKALSHQSKVKILLALILVVSFQHMFEVVQYFTTGWTGTISNFALVVWIDLMMFFCLDLIGKQTETRSRRAMGWLVFGVATAVSGFLNVFYFLNQRPQQISEEIKEIISLMLGGLPPIAVIFLGMVYRDTENIVIGVEAKRIADTEKSERLERMPPKVRTEIDSIKVSDSAVRKEERNKQVIEFYNQGKAIREIVRLTGTSKPTVHSILNAAGLRKSSNEVEE